MQYVMLHWKPLEPMGEIETLLLKKRMWMMATALKVRQPIRAQQPKLFTDCPQS